MRQTCVQGTGCATGRFTLDRDILIEPGKIYVGGGTFRTGLSFGSKPERLLKLEKGDVKVNVELEGIVYTDNTVKRF